MSWWLTEGPETRATMVPPFTMQAPHALGVSPNLEEKSWGVESVVLSNVLRVNVEDVCNILEAKLTFFCV